eukprot:6197765-Pleurochrysis_carterae.AAC.2
MEAQIQTLVQAKCGWHAIWPLDSSGGEVKQGRRSTCPFRQAVDNHNRLKMTWKASCSQAVPVLQCFRSTCPACP